MTENTLPFSEAERIHREVKIRGCDMSLPTPTTETGNKRPPPDLESKVLCKLAIPNTSANSCIAAGGDGLYCKVAGLRRVWIGKIK